MNAITLSQSSVPRQRGVTLIELMIGIVIAMFAVLLITQTLSSVEAQKRTATEGADAQTNGALALYTLQRDLGGAGYGLINTLLSATGCPIRARRGSTDFNFSLNPVTITDGGSDGSPDTIQFNASTKAGASATRVTTDHPPTAANFFVQSSFGVQQGDLMIAVPPGGQYSSTNWCTLFNASNDPGQGNQNGNGQGQGLNEVVHNSGNDGLWNQPGGSNIMPPGGYPAGSTIINIGQWISREYAISANRSLQLTEFLSTSATTSTSELFPHIVNLQALYGKDTNDDQIVDRYDAVLPATNAEWQQVIAVRIVVVARSAQFERDVVTAVQPLWDVGGSPTVVGSTSCGASQCLPLRVNDLADWQRYRYKVYETVVPLRNLIWGT